MKSFNLTRISTFCISVIFFSALVLGQTDQEKKDVQDVLVKVLNNSQSENYQAASTFFAYEGDNSARNLKDVYNFKDQKEKSKVKRLAKKIKAFQDLSDSYSVGDISKKSEPAGEYFLVEVLFNSGKQTLKTVFSFIKINENFKLVEVK